jgi:hypothetical protein
VEKQDIARWKCHYRLEKRHGDINACKTLEERLAFLENTKPYVVIEGEGNLLLNEGINEMWKLICGGTATAYNNTNARIGVGNGSTPAADAEQAGLQGGSTAFKAMEGGYPTSGTNQKAIFKSSFGAEDGNFAWEEWTVDNGAVADLNLNRKVESLGTKSGGTWTLEVSTTLS